MVQILMMLIQEETDRIITSLAVRATSKYKLYRNVNEGIEDLKTESYLILNEFKGNETSLVFYRRLRSYINKNKYANDKFTKCAQLEEIPVCLYTNSSPSAEKEMEEKEIQELFNEFRKTLSDTHLLIFNNLLDKSYSIKDVKLTRQRIDQIRNNLKRSLRSFLHKKQYRL